MSVNGSHGRRRIAGLIGALSATMLALIGLLAAPQSVSAATVGLLKVSPSGQTVAAGAPFQIDVTQQTSIPISQVQTDLDFDPSLVQITAVELGKPWANATFLFGTGITSVAGAVKAANESGTLTIGAGFLGRTVAAGDATYLTIAFQAANGPGGEAPLRLRNASMADASQNTIPVLVSSGSVTVSAGAVGTPSASGSAKPSASGSPAASTPPCVSASPSPSGAATASASASVKSASPSPLSSAGPCPAASPSPIASATPPASPTAVVYVVPAKDKIAVGDTLTVTLYSNSDNPLQSITLDFAFNRTVLQVVSVKPTGEWQGTALNVTRPSVVQALVDRANTMYLDPTNPNQGTLQGVGVTVSAEGADASVSGSFLTITMKAVANGTSNLIAENISATDTSGGDEAASAGGTASVVVGTSGGTGGGAGGWGVSLNLDWPLVISATILLLELLACLLLLVLPAKVIKAGFGLRLPNAPRVVSLALGLVPVILFAGCVVIVVLNALPAFSDPGPLAFFNTEFVSPYSTTANAATASAYGLLPALVGTVLIVGIALLIALPVSISLAVVTTEFQLGPIGRIARPLVTLMSGIPPIVYAVSMFVFVQVLMIPKFAADSTFQTFGNGAAIGADPSKWPPAGVPYNAGSYPWESTLGNSTLLGGILVGLLLVPFITPMIADAIRNVPNSIREASLALGANRSYTLRRTLLPTARPAIVSAVALGILKAAGDVVIVAFAVGWSADTIPSPILDIFARTPSLAVHAADMIVPLETPGSTNPPPLPAIGYVGALALMLLAMAVILVMHFFRRRWNKGLGQ